MTIKWATDKTKDFNEKRTCHFQFDCRVYLIFAILVIVAAEMHMTLIVIERVFREQVQISQSKAHDILFDDNCYVRPSCRHFNDIRS